MSRNKLIFYKNINLCRILSIKLYCILNFILYNIKYIIIQGDKKMSKLLTKFNVLKKENKETLYLFKSGIFYIAINEDALKLSEIFNFKITKLNDISTKCGFPSNKIDYYSNILKKCSVNYEIINNDTPISTLNTCQINFIKKISNLEITLIDELKAKETLLSLKSEAKQILENL